MTYTDEIDDSIFAETVFTDTAHQRMEEPVHIKGFKATYDRKFNLGNFQSLHAEISIWVKTRIPENAAFDLHDCKRRVRLMARQNIKAQYQRMSGDDSPAFLGLEPPSDGYADPIYVATIGVGLAQKVNLGDYNSIVPAYTDWADVRAAGNAQSGLHIALSRLWDGLWANVRDEIARVQGGGSTEDDFGLPFMEIEDLTNEVEDGAGTHSGVKNGSGYSFDLSLATNGSGS